LCWQHEFPEYIPQELKRPTVIGLTQDSEFDV
jgi:hypothetical protein